MARGGDYSRRLSCGTVEPPSLIETLRYERGYVRLERHLARLGSSAQELGHVWRPDAVRHALDQAAAGRHGPWRVRVLLPPNGNPLWEARRLPPPPPEPVRLAVAAPRIDGGNPWRRHKTTRRVAYDAATVEAQRLGLADLLFFDAEGYVVDGAVSSVFVQRGGRVVTPPVERGALPGVLRAELLDEGWAEEADVTSEALLGADAIWIGSSLRGLRRAWCARGVVSVPAAAP